MNIWKKSTFNRVKKNKISDQSFNNLIWKNKIDQKLRLNKTHLKKRYSKYFLTNSPLSLILIGYHKKRIKIADYGSGDQEILFQLLNNNFIDKEIIIDSVEVPVITKLLKKSINKKNFKNININFYDTFNFKKRYDFVHISDSLQYNLEWKLFLKKIVLKKPKFIILNNLTAGSFKTYITEQKFYKDKLPYIFFNEDEIIKIFKGYKVYEYLYLNKIHNQYKEYPQKNFRKKDRLKYPKTIILKKN